MNNREIRILLSQLCAAACVEFLCQSAVGDRPGPAGPSLTLGQSNRSAVPTALTYVNFLEAVLGDFRIWEIYGDFWIVGTLGILPPPQSVQLCCGPNGIIPHWHFWGIWSSGISFSSVNSKCDLKCIDCESWPLGPWVLLLGIAPCWGVEWIHNLGKLELLGYWKYCDIGNIGYFLKYWKYWDIFWGMEWTHNMGRVEISPKQRSSAMSILLNNCHETVNKWRCRL